MALSMQKYHDVMMVNIDDDVKEIDDNHLTHGFEHAQNIMMVWLWGLEKLMTFTSHMAQRMQKCHDYHNHDYYDDDNANDTDFV